MEYKGAEYAQKAEEVLNKKSFLGVFGIGTEDKFENAAGLYVKSGNAYKVAHHHEEAGMMYEKASANYLSAGDKLDSLKAMVDAAQSYKSASPPQIEKAQRAYNAVITTLSVDGKFGQCARHYRDMAEMFEADGAMDTAFENYENAASMFENDNKSGDARKMNLKVATMASEGGDYARACLIFERVGKQSMETRLGAHSAKGYFFQALLCFMASGDSVAASQKLEEYTGLDYTFPTSREHGLVSKLLEAWDNMDGDAFGEACETYDRISPLDPWKVAMLGACKKYIVGTGDGGDGGDIEDDGVDLT